MSCCNLGLGLPVGNLPKNFLLSKLCTRAFRTFQPHLFYHLSIVRQKLLITKLSAALIIQLTVLRKFPD